MKKQSNRQQNSAKDSKGTISWERFTELVKFYRKKYGVSDLDFKIVSPPTDDSITITIFLNPNFSIQEKENQRKQKSS